MATVKANISAGYPGHGVLTDINLTVPPGFTVMVGANGSGKSTLMRTIAGLLRPLKGAVSIDGRDIRTLGHRELARKVCFIGSGGGMSTSLTVRQVVEAGRHPYTGILGILSAADVLAVENAMADVGINSLADKRISDISDGERQKSLIAKALSQQASVMLLDEPTSYLDVASRLEVLRLLKELATEKGITLVVSTHDVAPALAVADYVISIVPEAQTPVVIQPAHSPELSQRLDNVFAARGIHYNPVTGNFEI